MLRYIKPYGVIEQGRIDTYGFYSDVFKSSVFYLQLLPNVYMGEGPDSHYFIYSGFNRLDVQFGSGIADTILLYPRDYYYGTAVPGWDIVGEGIDYYLVEYSNATIIIKKDLFWRRESALDYLSDPLYSYFIVDPDVVTISGVFSYSYKNLRGVGAYEGLGGKLRTPEFDYYKSETLLGDYVPMHGSVESNQDGIMIGFSVCKDALGNRYKYNRQFAREGLGDILYDGYSYKIHKDGLTYKSAEAPTNLHKGPYSFKCDSSEGVEPLVLSFVDMSYESDIYPDFYVGDIVKWI